MLREIDPRTALPTQICHIWVLGTPIVWLFIEVRLQTSYVYFFVYLSLLESNCTVCKYFFGSIRFLLIIIYFVVNASHFHINLIDYCVVMCDLPIVLLNIINILFSLLNIGYNSPVYDWREVELHVSYKDSLAWCGHYSTVIRGSYR